MTKDLSLRATLEDVLKRQKQLRDVIEQLIEEDRPITDKPERDRIFDLVCRSCLGLEHHVNATFKTSTKEGGVATWNGTLTDLLRTAMYLNGPLTFEMENGQEAIVQLKAVWKLILDFLYGAFALARDRATSVSAERIPFEPTTAERF